MVIKTGIALLSGDSGSGGLEDNRCRNTNASQTCAGEIQQFFQSRSRGTICRMTGDVSDERSNWNGKCIPIHCGCTGRIASKQGSFGRSQYHLRCAYGRDFFLIPEANLKCANEIAPLQSMFSATDPRPPFVARSLFRYGGNKFFIGHLSIALKSGGDAPIQEL